MIIAIDFDGTFTADPILWSKFIRLAKEHEVICVTSRRNTQANQNFLSSTFLDYGVKIPIYFCNLNSKLEMMYRYDVRVDIWIDNDPMSLVNGVE